MLHLKQDDPRKNTALKMIRFGLIERIRDARHIRRTCLVLNPTSTRPLSVEDHMLLVKRGLTVVDCSWKLVEDVFKNRLRGFQRRLPLLLASNPVNYGQVAKLSSAEAVAGALFISGFKEYAAKILSIFSWGHSFFSLNRELLESYSKASNADAILTCERSFF